MLHIEDHQAHPASACIQSLLSGIILPRKCIVWALVYRLCNYLDHDGRSLLLQVVMLGSGVPEYEQQMRRAEQERPDAFRGWVGFSIPVSHRMMAGCDILLMPSRFEPCGLNQLFAMRYGTIPIAHATGGLRDTIEDYNPFAQGESAWPS